MKRTAMTVNLLLLGGTASPLAIVQGSNVSIHAACLSSVLVVCGFAALAASLWARHLRDDTLCSRKVSACKQTGVRQAIAIGCADLWLVPSRCLVHVCLLRWSRNVLRHGATVGTALISSFSAQYLLMAGLTLALALLCLRDDARGLLGSGEGMGAWLTLLAAVFSWLAVLHLFHWFFRWFLIGRTLRPTRPTFSECNVAFADRAAVLSHQRQAGLPGARHGQ